MGDRTQRQLSLPMELVWEAIGCIPADHVIRIKRSGPARSAALNFVIAKFFRRYFVLDTIELVKAFIEKLSRVGEPSIQIVTAMSQYEHILGGPGLFTSITTSVQALKNLYGLAFAQKMFLQSMEGDMLEHYREYVNKTFSWASDARAELLKITGDPNIRANAEVHGYFEKLVETSQGLIDEFGGAATSSPENSPSETPHSISNTPENNDQQ